MRLPESFGETPTPPEKPDNPEDVENQEEGEEEDPVVTLAEDATFADLAQACDEIENDVGIDGLHLDEELWDNFDDEMVEEVLALLEEGNQEAAQSKIVDFFQGYGYTIEDIEAYLPIVFAKKAE